MRTCVPRRTRLLQLQGAGKNLLRMPFLVKIQHQPRQRPEGVGGGTVVVLEGGAMGCPHGQAVLQFFIARLDAAAHFRQPGLASQGLPLRAGGGEDGRAVTPSDAGESRLVVVIVHRF